MASESPQEDMVPWDMTDRYISLTGGSRHLNRVGLRELMASYKQVPSSSSI